MIENLTRRNPFFRVKKEELQNHLDLQALRDPRRDLNLYQARDPRNLVRGVPPMEGVVLRGVALERAVVLLQGVRQDPRVDKRKGPHQIPNEWVPTPKSVSLIIME